MRYMTPHTYGWSAKAEAAGSEIQWFAPKGQMVKRDGTYHTYRSEKVKKAWVNDNGLLIIYIYQRVDKGAKEEAVVSLRSRPNIQVEFDIGLVWDERIWWYIKLKDALHFGDVFVGGPNGNIQLAFQDPVDYEDITAEDWESEGLH